MPFSRLHAKPKALYKAVVDATTDDERAAAVAALEEYEGSNGVCYDCRLSYLTDPEKQKTRPWKWRGPQRCPAAALLPDANHSGAGNFPTGQYRKEGKGPVLFTWKGRCCKKGCADAVAKALYQHEHENVPYPEGFTPPSS